MAHVSGIPWQIREAGRPGGRHRDSGRLQTVLQRRITLSCDAWPGCSSRETDRCFPGRRGCRSRRAPVRRREASAAHAFPHLFQLRLRLIDPVGFLGRHAVELAVLLLSAVWGFFEWREAPRSGVCRFPPLIVTRGILGLFLPIPVARAFSCQVPGLVPPSRQRAMPQRHDAGRADASFA